MWWKRDSGAVSAGVSIAASLDAHAIREQLAALEDEDQYNASHARNMLRHNVTSPLFWMLVVASTCFAGLNAHHGYVTSGGEAAIAVSVVIGMLYSVIEMTIPISAHLISWSAPGIAKVFIRLIGVVAFVLGVTFSLTILQSNFTTGAEQSQTRAENNADLLASDRAAFKQLTADVKSLSAELNGRSASSLDDDMKTLLAQPVTKGRPDTLADVTDSCTGERRTSKSREQCAQFDTLKRLRGKANDLATKQAELTQVSGRIRYASEDGTVTQANKADAIIAGAFGFDVKNLTDIKPTIIALVAAFLTHILWAAHGASVNVSIARQRNSVLKKASLKRALITHERVAGERAAMVTREFMEKRGGVHEKAAAAIANASLMDQPIQLQVTQFLNERAVLGAEFEQSIGLIHDEYSRWATSNNVERISIDKFRGVLKSLGLDVARDGRVLGAALK